MKKLLIAAAAIAVGSACMADAIESANVVGYTTVTFAAGDRYVICGIPFDSTTDAEGISIQDLIPDPLNNGWTGAGNSGGADQIQIWDGGKYLTLYLNDNTLTSTAGQARKGKWINPGALTAEQKLTWGNPNQPSTLKLTPGMSFWIVRANGTQSAAKTVTLSGQVVTSSANATHTIAPGYNLLTSGYTGGFALNNGYINWLSLGAVGGGNSGAADQIQLWDGGKYLTLYLNDNTLTSTAGQARKGKWINPGALTDEQKLIWGNPNQPSSLVLKPGDGFWYYHKGSGFTFTEQKPYDL